jgi:hypothetical protein
MRNSKGPKPLWTVSVTRELGAKEVVRALRDSSKALAVAGKSATAMLRAAEVAPSGTRLFFEGSREAIDGYARALEKRTRGAKAVVARSSVNELNRRR